MSITSPIPAALLAALADRDRLAQQGLIIARVEHGWRLLGVTYVQLTQALAAARRFS